MSQPPPDPPEPYEYGYGPQDEYAYSAYQQNGYYQPQPPPPKPKWPWFVAGGGALVVVGLAVVAGVVVLGSGGDNRVNAAASASPSSASRSVSRTAPPSAAITGAAAPRTPAAVSDGLPTNGILKVGTDIEPGEYAVSPSGATSGYWERLSCLSGDFECIITNDLVSGDGYLSVQPGDAAVKVQNLRLVATGEPAQGPSPRSESSYSDVADTDAQGFVGRSAARCNADNDAVSIARTTKSLVVVCETGVGRYYYKGLRLKDGAAIEIDDPVRTGSGFTATNSGVRYSLDGSALEITDGSKELASEPVLQYWSD